jgi:cytochrome c oxidase subunit 1
MFGGTGFALFAAMHYWFPKMFGRMFRKGPALASCLMMTVGFNLLYFPMFVLGYLGMPRRYYDYLPQYQPLHEIATVGSWILALGIFTALINLWLSMRNGPKAGPNPWGGKTLEWTVPSPPPVENFHDIPVITTGPYDYSEYEHRSAEAK